MIRRFLHILRCTEPRRVAPAATAFRGPGFLHRPACKILTVICLVALMVVRPGAFGATPAELLRRSEEADKHVDYRGIKRATVAFGERTAVATMKVIHLRPDLTRTVYYAPEALAGIIVIRNGPDGWKYCPRQDVWEPIGRCAMRCNETIRRDALRNYDVRLVGTERVAGRAA